MLAVDPQLCNGVLVFIMAFLGSVAGSAWVGHVLRRQ